MAPPEEERKPDSRGPEGAARTDSSTFLDRLKGDRTPSDRLRLVDEIARGGMGIIQRIWDSDLQRYLAKKLILGPEAEPARVDPQMLSRFLEEAQISGQLEHPGIVPVHEVGIDAEGRVFFTMQLVKGRELTEIFELVRGEREGWSTTRALGVILKVCEAMAYAHDKGVIHRDLKPANVMVGRFGEVYVMDWGLAHVLGEKARKRDHQNSTTMLTLDSVRDEVQGGDSMRTMDGDVIGTPSFMSPQQARGRLSELDARGDVYSLGAILYCLLAGRAPYTEPGEKQGALAVLQKLLSGPPTPVLDLAPDVPGELVAICDKAMARDLRDRYINMQELAEDLRAFLENRVVQAFETGAVAELKKWVVRNRGLAVAIVSAVILALAGLGAVVFVEARGRRAADAQRAIALANEEEARLNAIEANENAERARRERANVLRLSAFQQLEDLQAEAEDLWPPLPDLVPRYQSWIARAEALVAGLQPHPDGEHDGHYAQLAELRARALPADPETDREHPRYAELEMMRARLASEEQAYRIAHGGAPLAPVILAAEDRKLSGADLNQRAWELVGDTRSTFGREAEGLALARLALARAETAFERAQFGDTLAWAFFQCGRDEDALAASQEALAVVPAERRSEYQGYLEKLETAIDARSGEKGQLALERLEDELVALEEQIEAERPWDFADDNDRWWHSQLSKLVAELEAFDAPETGLFRGLSARWGWGIERRLEFARSVEERTIAGPEAREAWDEAIASIADPAECPLYGGLQLEPQLGLVPIGRDSQSGLWEFAHVMSGEIPDRTDDGTLLFEEETCVVMVLLPPGTFDVGAQPADRSAPNYDPLAESNESPVHSVELSAFFMSKNELTQGQWARTQGVNPSRYKEVTILGHRIDERHPVESVSWADCERTLARMDLQLPTEAQWEYATRAGTDTPWWTGRERDSLIGAVNIADHTATLVAAKWSSIADWPDLDDGWPVHAPVGLRYANAFGLHDVHGNVREWCLEPMGDYPGRMRAGDGMKVSFGGANRIFRGGSFSTTAGRARSASRGVFPQKTVFNDLGVRPARAVRSRSSD